MTRLARRLLPALMLAFSPQLAAQSNAVGDPAAEAVEGAWIVTVGENSRDRFLIISGAKSEQGEIKVQSATYGWVDGKALPVKNWRAEIFGDLIHMRFTTPANSGISVEFKAGTSTVSGSFTLLRSRNQVLRMTRIPPEELEELRAAARQSARAKPATPRARASANSNITLLYVGANDCPSCRGFEIDYIANRKIDKVVPEFASIGYVKSQLVSYTSPGRTGDLPQDLKWVEGNDASGKALLKRRGVPFFALIVDKQVWTQGHGLAALETLLAPQIKRAVAEKSRAAGKPSAETAPQGAQGSS